MSKAIRCALIGIGPKHVRSLYFHGLIDQDRHRLIHSSETLFDYNFHDLFDWIIFCCVVYSAPSFFVVN